MKLVPKTYTQPLDLFDRFFNRLVPGSLFGCAWNESWDPFRMLDTFPERMISPAVDMEETDKEIIVKAEMPGMEKDDFSLEIEQDHLILRGEKKQEREEKDRNYHRVECSYGRFSRTLPLPCGIDADSANAEYRNGVLTITLPKSESARRKAVKVNIS